MKINVLGGLEIKGSGKKPLTRKAKAVAAYLVLQRGRPQSREQLAALFWENSPQEQARTNLRQCLSTLRKHFEDALIADADAILIDPSNIDTDVERFEESINSDDLEVLTQAIRLYKGDLLDGFGVKEEAFEAWIRAERERYRMLMVDGLTRLIGQCEATNDAGSAVRFATRLLALDPLNENVHRSLMRAYTAQDRYDAALKQFEVCKDILRRDLDVQPQPETLALIKDIRAQRNELAAPLSVQEHDTGSGRASGTEKSGYTLSDQSNVRYVQSSDGVSIAYADVGEGHPMVLLGGWMTHLEKDWDSPVMRYFLTHLSESFRLIRIDQRGQGMSDWTHVDISSEKMVDDVECVIDQFDFQKVAIFATSQGAAVSIAYAVRHPDRVSHLILHGGYARGRCRRGEPGAAAESEAMVTLIRQRWGAENPAFRQYMTSLFIPDASQEDASWFNDFQRTCGPGENMARFREMFDEMDISELLSQVRVPTLILHCTGDAVAPISEGKFMASRIPGAQFILLESNNHMIFENEPDFPKFVQSIRNFIQ
ncbi:MAG: alpha/beta fold hydrolase [Rhizobiales bacterium]|nr:alpha/beta fold hydrolase [Hyphomicrobiales bacterium]